MNKWIPIEEQKPPKPCETPETDGFYWVLVPYGGNCSRCYAMVWAGSPFRRATHWARVEPFPALPDGLVNE